MSCFFCFLWCGCVVVGGVVSVLVFIVGDLICVYLRVHDLLSSSSYVIVLSLIVIADDISRFLCILSSSGGIILIFGGGPWTCLVASPFGEASHIFIILCVDLDVGTGYDGAIGSSSFSHRSFSSIVHALAS